MDRLASITWTALVLGGCMVSTGRAQSPDRTADAILAELKDLESNAPSRLDATQAKDAESYKNFQAKMQKIFEKTAELAIELYKIAPGHEKMCPS